MAQTPTNQSPSSSGGAASQANVTQQEREEVYRTKLFEIITDILNTGMDLGLSLIDIDCPKKNECPLYQYSVEMVRKLRELKEISKQMRRK